MIVTIGVETVTDEVTVAPGDVSVAVVVTVY